MHERSTSGRKSLSKEILFLKEDKCLHYFKTFLKEIFDPCFVFSWNQTHTPPQRNWLQLPTLFLSGTLTPLFFWLQILVGN